MSSSFPTDREPAGRRPASPRRAPGRRGSRPARGPAPPSAGGYDDAFAGVYARLGATLATLRRERQAAPGRVDELLAASAEKRRLLIRNLGRFRSWVLADFFLRRARGAWADDPATSEELARVALAIAEELDLAAGGRLVVYDLQARAWSYIANARRIASDLRSAERAFHRAERLLDHGTGDPLERGRLLDLEASLYRDLRRLDDATARLDRATAAYRQAGDLALAARALIKRAMICREGGHPELGIPLLRRAATHVDAERDRRLLLSVRHNLITCLNEAGDSVQAQAMLPALRKLALELGQRLDLLRVRWLDGQVAASLGYLTRAEWSLAAARDGFLRCGIAYDVALISLDLAGVYLRQGRTSETRRLAAEAVTLLEIQEVHRDALAAMLLFAEAAERETLTLQQLADLGGRLERAARRRPAARCD